MNDYGGLSSISLIVITLNEEDNIGRCLESARGVGEVIVVDSSSTDGTVEIAERYGATVYTRDFTSNADQKNWAIEKAANDWILILDADESLSPELKLEIAEKTADPGADGYRIRRRNEFFGSRIRFCGWNRDRVTRFFKRGAGRYSERTVHEKLALEGRMGELKGYLEHRSYRDIDDYIDRMKSYSGRGAFELRNMGKRWFPGILLRPPARFFRMYILQLGFLDGLAGMLLCALASIGVFFKYAYLRELYRNDTET